MMSINTWGEISHGEETVTRRSAGRRCLLLKKPPYPVLSPSHMVTRLCAHAVPGFLAGDPCSAVQAAGSHHS